MSGLANIPQPHNEPVLTYAPGNAERAALKGALTTVGVERPEIPAVVGGREIRSGVTQNVIAPHCHARVLATLHLADGGTIAAAVKSAVEAQRDWAHWRFEDRAAVFLKPPTCRSVAAACPGTAGTARTSSSERWPRRQARALPLPAARRAGLSASG